MIGQLVGLVAGSLLAILGLTTAASAQDAKDFYRGKNMRLLIGYGPGGGYDLYGRLVAEFLPKFLPGNPSILSQNMPGAGSFLAAKYMAEVAPKDGTILGSLAQTLALDSIVSNTANIDVSKFSYIGRVVSNIDTGVALPKSGIKTFDDTRHRPFTVGASGGGSTTVLFPSALNTYAGSQFKLVRGYSGTTDIQLAMERGEVDIVGAYGLPGILISKPGWIERGEASILYQASLKRHHLLPNVPTLPELATDDEGREVLRAVASTGEIGRSILTTPGVPADRLALLREAFNTMLSDPDFLAACQKRGLMVDAASGEDMDAIVRETLQMPKSIIAKVAQLTN
ncbi:Tripartite-type tricarboxylate transporter, receptor component TctC [Beijerinckia sp. 28-YEA-48]|nr:Tripartite-type tricarboxylate transporter, receptor component TctC [Beijerinckia sp. 28-YEA-48]